ncbi:MAG: acetyl-CoA carboxylase, biotin carboxyl carrier protein [Alphaproteobacteria bacterium 41-28]|nr:MAG: acetyl-CoA carboxylase, biotin carboxyl carrier protein [Alphaproteobacteria bacterium 41-28]
MPEKFAVDGESVRGLAKLLEETGLTEIEYQVGTHRIRVARGSMQAPLPHSTPQVPPAPPPLPSSSAPTSQPEAPASPEAPVPHGEIITSPMVGTVYLAPEQGGEPFIKVGDSVKKGDTLLIVEAMKVMNPIRAPRDGTVLDICVSDTKPIEFGEPLVILE